MIVYLPIQSVEENGWIRWLIHLDCTVVLKRWNRCSYFNSSMVANELSICQGLKLLRVEIKPSHGSISTLLIINLIWLQDSSKNCTEFLGPFCGYKKLQLCICAYFLLFVVIIMRFFTMNKKRASRDKPFF